MTLAKSPQSDESLEALLQEIQPRLRGVLATFRIPFEDAEDLLQQSLLAFLVKREGVYDPRSWLIGTLRNRCLMYWRTRRRSLYESVDSAILESIAEPQRPAQEQRDLASDLNGALRKLSPKCQSVLKLRYGLGCAPAETARTLGYRESSIYKIVERCLAGLMRTLVSSGAFEELADKKRAS